MKLLPEMSTQIINLLNSTPLQHILHTATFSPEIFMVYADNETTPSSCVVRIDSLLFFGGKITSECLTYLKTKILTFEIYEKYGVFYLFYPDELWCNALLIQFPGRSKIYDRTSYSNHSITISREQQSITALSCVFRHAAADCSAIYLDLRSLNKSGRAPEECVVQNIVQKYLPDTEIVRRVPKGASTYVYQVKTSSKIYYARFLPENCSFAAEVLAHQLILDIGVYVPQIISFEHKEKQSKLSMMLVKEIPGESVEDVWPDSNVSDILREAGKQLALIHTISVDGFGWIDRNSYDLLKGEKRTFREYFDDYLHDDLNTLHYYDFSIDEKKKIRNYMEQAGKILDVEAATLVHGDFDISHIYHSEGNFSGFIDFGEIRGNHRFFDLATFTMNDSSVNRLAYYYLIDGYREITQITNDDLYAIELMALFIALRFAGKKFETKSREYWCQLIRKQLKRLNHFNFEGGNK